MFNALLTSPAENEPEGLPRGPKAEVASTISLRQPVRVVLLLKFCRKVEQVELMPDGMRGLAVEAGEAALEEPCEILVSLDSST